MTGCHRRISSQGRGQKLVSTTLIDSRPLADSLPPAPDKLGDLPGISGRLVPADDLRPTGGEFLGGYHATLAQIV